MLRLRPGLALASAILFAACAGGGPTPGSTTPEPTANGSPGAPSSAPASGGPSPVDTPTASPDQSPAASPGEQLDPSLSDAGVVGVAILPDDTRGGRTGSHLIVGQRSAASGCSNSFDGTEFTAVAWVDDAEDGELARLSVTVPSDIVPQADGIAQDIDGRVSFDFISESGFGTLYTGDASDEDGSATIDAVRAGVLLSFTFEGVTWDEVAFSGQLVCALD